MTIRDLKELDVQFIVTNDELALTDSELEQLTVIYGFGNWRIYELQ